MRLLRNRIAAAALAAAALTSVAATSGPADADTTDTTDAAASTQAANLDLDLLHLDEAGLGRVMVRYGNGIPGGLLGELTDLGVTRALEFSTIDTVAVTGTPAVLEQVLTDPRVEAFHQQRRIQLDLYASRSQINAEEADQPRDYEQDIDDEQVTRTRPGATGAGVTVGIIDSGVEVSHPDTANTTTGLNFSFAGLKEAGAISNEEWDQYVTSTGALALQDDIGHGTHVASTVGGTGELAAQTDGPDLSGVAPETEFISLKITTAPAGIVEDFDFEESAVGAFDYILRHNDELGIDVTNNSWGLLPTEPNCLGTACFGLGEETDFDAAREISDAVVAAGIDVVFSAGNDGQDGENSTIGDHVGFDTITVAAGCKDDEVTGCAEGQDITDFSSRGAADGSGRQVDITAPGDQIMAAMSPSVLAPLTECPEAQHPGYFCISGTSMSSPHIAGVAALMREVNPDLTPAELKQCLLSTATPLPNALKLDEAQVVRDGGAGMADTEAALQCAHELTPVDGAAQGAAPTDAPGNTPASDRAAAGAPADRTEGPSGVQAAAAESLPNTGGGSALLGIGLLAGAGAALRRRAA